MNLSTIAARILRLRDPRYRILSQLFAEQRAFIADPSEWKAACCTRRAGKSHVATAGLLDAAFSHDNTDVLYLGLTRQSSEKIMWPKFHEMKALLGDKIELKNSKLCVETANNSRIWLIGADSPGLIDRLLGNKWKRVIIDEAQSFGAHVEYLIDDVLSPALLDLSGDLWLLGTPGPIPNGYFYNAIANPSSSFARHKWSLFNNPHLPHAREWLEKLKKRKGWTEENPTYRRQYLGEWCLDLDALVYRWNPSRNRAKELPSGHQWNYVLGLDYGWHDATAFALIAYANDCPNAYIVRCWGASGLIPSRIAEIVCQLNEQYSLEAIVCDTGGLGKSITEEFRQRYGLPVRAAEKTDKMAFIATVNGDYLDGRIFTLPGCEELEHQYQTLTYDERRKEDPTLPNDRCLSGDTLIATENGSVPIKSITAGTRVWTRLGWKSVKKVWNNGFKQTMRIKLSDGSSIQCTNDHHVYVHGIGFIRADMVLYGYRMETIRCQKLKSSMESYGEDTPNPNSDLCGNTFIGFSRSMARHAWSSCIDMFMRNTMGLFRKVIRFITRMRISQTTELRIWDVLRQMIIGKDIQNGRVEMAHQKRCSNIWKLLGFRLQNGTQVPKAENGINSTRKDSWATGIATRFLAFAPYVALPTQGRKTQSAIDLFVLTNAMPKTEESGESITKQANAHIAELSFNTADSTFRTYAVKVVAVEDTKRVENVWDLEIEDAHHFYANGILVHNCDAATYGLRYVRHYLAVEKEEPLKIGSPEWIAREEKDMIRAVETSTRQAQENSDVWGGLFS